MDYDSSTKFISSLAKFLQSLCNGYVEFDNGVEVIGHIYLSVDTGKKIDYILNEKVCKTDENSVTFISNSFHAQPAEKPKPSSKKGKSDQTDDKAHDEFVELNDDSNGQIEPRSTNSGTIPRNSNRNLHSPSSRHGKRPFSPHSKSVSSPGSKKGRTESQEHGAGLFSDENNLSSSNPTSDPLRGHSGLPSDSSYTHSFDPGYNPAMDNSVPEDSEERDIKPSMDTDVTFVKEEFTPSSCSQVEDDANQGVEAYSSMYHSNQSYPGGGGPSGQQYGQQNSRLSYGAAGDRSDVFDGGMRSSQMEGNDGGTDPSVAQGDAENWPFYLPPSDQLIDESWFYHKANIKDVKPPRFGRHLNHTKSCRKCGMTSRDGLDMNIHKKTCTGKRHLTCRVCSKVLSRYDALAEHLRGIHGIGKKVACMFCGRSFKYKPQKYQHQATCPKRMMDPVPSPIDTDTDRLLHVKSEPSVDFSTKSLLPPPPPPPHVNFTPDVKSIISFPYDQNVST